MKDINVSVTKDWVNPLPECIWPLPLGKYQTGGFGARRQYNVHSGVDLLCANNQPLASVEDGTVVGIQDFSKKKEKAWLNNTRVIFIEGATGVVVYCNVIEKNDLKIGQQVKAGEVIGKVIKINRYKRKEDICMLHIELYTHGNYRRAIWSYNHKKPQQLLDPTNFLISAISSKR